MKAAAHSKIEGYAARLALVLNLARWAGDDDCDPAIVDKRSMDAGIALATWYAGEADRVYAMLASDAPYAGADRLVEFIRARGGVATVRDIRQSGPAHLRSGKADATAVRAALEEWRKEYPNDEPRVIPMAMGWTGNFAGMYIRRPITEAIKKAGVKPWKKMWQNLRATRVNELRNKYPPHVVNAWMGHTEEVAEAHYTEVWAEHFDDAITA